MLVCVWWFGPLSGTPIHIDCFVFQSGHSSAFRKLYVMSFLRTECALYFPRENRGIIFFFR